MNLAIGMLVIISLLSLVEASSIIANPSTLNINLTKSVSKTITINITNPNNYSLYDIVAEGSVVMSSSTLPTLSGNTNSTLSFVVKVDEKGNLSKIITIVGFTHINCSEMGVTTYNINITPAGTNPRDLDICKGDNIRYTNNYGSSVWLDIDSLSVYQVIPNLGSHVQNFPNNGLIPYRIEPLIDLGYIDVSEGVSNVHNIENDGVLNLNIYSTLEETNITINFNKINFTLNFDEIGTGYVIIKNTGDKLAESVKLIGDWLSFDNNNFNINPGEEKAINFVVAPIISQSSDTNKSYIKVTHISGDNFNTLTQNISVFVNYANVAAGNISSPEWWIRRKAFCDAYPTSPDCLTEPYIVYRDKVVYDAPPILMNMSPQDVKNYIDSVQDLKKMWNDYNNNWKTDTDIIKSELLESNDIANSSYSQSLTNEKSFKSFRNSFYMIFGTFVVFLMSGVVAIFLWRYYIINKRKMLDII